MTSRYLQALFVKRVAIRKVDLFYAPFANRYAVIFADPVAVEKAFMMQ